MESAFVDDIAGIFGPFLRFSPVFCPVIFPRITHTPALMSMVFSAFCASADFGNTIVRTPLLKVRFDLLFVNAGGHSEGSLK